VTMDPSDVFRQEIAILRKRNFAVAQTVRLEPYEKDHALVLVNRA
jgi:fibrillarin-like rRNA methylase